MSIVRRRRPERQLDEPGSGPAMFIEQEDHTLMELCFSTYEHLITEKNGWELTLVGSVFARSWVQGSSVIIGIRGTALTGPGGFTNLVDDTIIAGLIGSDKCALHIVNDVSKYIEDFIERGFCEIIVCGHSLGGEAAFCLANKYAAVTRAVAFNGAAPASGGEFIGAGKERSRSYHIVGDVVSTHIDSDFCDVRRIKLIEDRPTDWGNPFYYHAAERFIDHKRKWKLWSAQEEQNDMQDYVYHSTIKSTLIEVSLGVISKRINPAQLRQFVCSHPIPGSVSGGACNKDRGMGRTGQAIGAFAGGLLGLVLGGTAGLAALGVTGLATGAYVGYKLAKGDGILDILQGQIV